MRTSLFHTEQSVPVPASAPCHGASIGPSSSILQAARQRAPRRGGVQQLSAHVAEPSASSRQLLEAMFIADSRDAPWLSTSLAWHRSLAEQAVTQLAVQLDDPPDAVKEREERRKRQEFYANVGDAIRTLREEIPLLFVQDFTCESPLSGCLRLTWTSHSPLTRPAHVALSSLGVPTAVASPHTPCLRKAFFPRRGTLAHRF